MSASSRINAYSERLMPPFSGQVQIAQTKTYRALTIDGQTWEIQYVNRSHVRVATLSTADIKAHVLNPKQHEGATVDDEFNELLDYINNVKLPFPATDCYEYWLLDSQDEAPLALIFSCAQSTQIEKYPDRPEWTALPAAVMPIKKTIEEEENQTPPVNYRLESLVANRAGTRRKAQWFNRNEPQKKYFPPLMIREDWPDPSEQALCQRYIERQAPRLLMLHGLSQSDRQRLESYSPPQAMEVARFCGLYPEILDDSLIQALRVEARLRAAASGESQPALHKRRDGILYI